jgi:hypothetical protein
MTAAKVGASRVRRRNYGRNHAYYLTREDGSEVKLDGVTTLLSEGLAKPALVNWAANTTAAYAVDNWEELGALPPSKRLQELKSAKQKDLDAAGRRGTEVHALAEKVLHGEEVEVPDAIAGHVESAVRFLDEWEIEPVLSETTVFNATRGYGGTFDMVVRSRRLPGRVILGDWKTTRSGIFNETALQLSAYGNGEFYLDANGDDQPMADLGITDHWGVWIRADGYSVHPVDRSERTFESFLYVATVARRARQWKEESLVGSAMERTAA